MSGDVAEESEGENNTQSDTEDLSLGQFEVNTVDNIKPINLESPQNSRKTKKSDSKENDLIMQIALPFYFK